MSTTTPATSQVLRAPPAYNDLAHKHAVTHLAGTQKYWYDANGNMTRRINFSLDVNYSYDAENHLTGVSGGKTATFVYDGDGKLVKTTVGSVTVAIAGDHYQYSGTTGTKHYQAGGVRIAERVGGGLYYLLGDHLGSTAVTTDQNGAYVTELRYYPYGRPRYNPGSQQTDYRFTGQRWQNDIGLYNYGARWYDHLIGRFAQADTIVSEPGNPQSLNRYAYVLNNPLRYTDPTGHAECASDDCVVRIHPVSGRPLGMRQKWGIVLKGPWEADKAWQVAGGMEAMAQRVGSELGGADQGDSWVRSNLGGVNFVRWPTDELPPHPILTLTKLHTLWSSIVGRTPVWPDGPTGLALPAHYPFLDKEDDTIYFFNAMNETSPVHESGHILDYRHKYASKTMAELVSIQRSPTVYGRMNRLEDFAESWLAWTYDRPELSQDRRAFFESFVVSGRN